MDIMVPPDDNGALVKSLDEMGIPHGMMIEDVQDLIDREARGHAKTRSREKRHQVTLMGWYRYYTFKEIVQHIGTLCRKTLL